MKTKTLLTTLAALTLIGCGGGSGTDPVEYVPYPDAPAISAAQKADFLDAVNDARAVGRTYGKYGYMDAVPALKWDDRLYRAAYEHSNDMAITGHMAHSGSGTNHDWTAQVLDIDRGSTVAERGLNNGVDYMGENWGAQGIEDLAGMMNWWLNSEGHCRNIMYPNYDTLGMGMVENSNSSQYHIYWTQTFGAE